MSNFIIICNQGVINSYIKCNRPERNYSTNEPLSSGNHGEERHLFAIKYGMWPALGWSWLTKCFIEMDLKLAAPKTDWGPASFTLCQSYIRFTEKYLIAKFTMSNLKRELLGTILYNFS